MELVASSHVTQRSSLTSFKLKNSHVTTQPLEVPLKLHTLNWPHSCHEVLQKLLPFNGL